jgi:hypothetical protein
MSALAHFADSSRTSPHIRDVPRATSHRFKTLEVGPGPYRHVGQTCILRSWAFEISPHYRQDGRMVNHALMDDEKDSLP